MMRWIRALLILAFLVPTVAQAAADPNATANAQAVLAYLNGLRTQSSHRVLTGSSIWRDMVQDNIAIAAGNPRPPYEWGQPQSVFAATGQYPAIVTLVEQHSDVARAFAVDHWSKGGLVQSHILAFNRPESWYGHTPLTNAEVTAVMSDSRYIAILDEYVADFLYYQSQGVVILNRLYFEMNGNWNWFSAPDANVYKTLWIHFYNYMISHGVHNLLYYYCPNGGSGSYLSFYPGDQYVDIVGLDSYQDLGTSPMPVVGGYTEMSALNKPLMLGEYGFFTLDLPLSYQHRDSTYLLQGLQTNMPNVVGVSHWTIPYDIAAMTNPSTYMTSSYVQNRPVPWQSGVFWDDELEAGSTGYTLPTGYASTPMTFDTTVKFSGSGSLRYNFDAVCYPDVSAQTNCGGYADRTFPATDRLYRRVMVRLSQDFVVSDVYTKLFRSDTNTNNSNWWVMGCCNWNRFGVGNQNVPAIGQTMNVQTSYDIPRNRWVCLETYEQLNTPGVANGVQQAWADGVQILNRSDIMFRTAGDNGQYVNNRLYRQTGLGSIWFDRLAVGSQRIGCVGSTTPSDTTAPSMPTAFSGNAPTGWTVNLSWTNSTAIDLSGTTIRRLTGVGTPTAALTTVLSPTATFTDSSVAPNTTYSYAINNYDSSGNGSPYTTAIQVTTPAAAGTTSITVDATFNSATTNLTNSVTWNHTVGSGLNRLLKVCAFARDEVSAGTPIVSSITANGFPLTKARADLFSSVEPVYMNTELWYLVNPGVGTQPITINFAGAPNRYGVGQSTSYFGVLQTAPLDASSGATGTGTAVSTDITTATNHAMITDCALGRADLTVGAGQTANSNYLTTVFVDQVGASTVADKTPAGVEAMNWTQTSAQSYATTAAAFKPATESPAIEPTIASLALSASGATLTHGATTATTIRVTVGSNSSPVTQTVVEPIASFPGGVYTHAWPDGYDWVCFYPRNSDGVENPASDANKCGSLSGIVAALDTTPVVMTQILPAGTLNQGTTETTVALSLDKQPSASCRYALTNIAYDSMTLPLTPANLVRSIAVSGLTNGTTTHYYAHCRYTNAIGTDVTTSTALDMTATVANTAPADTTAPGTVTGLVGATLSQSQVQLTWNAATGGDVAFYQVYQDLTGTCSGFAAVGVPVTTTDTVANIPPNHSTSFVVRAIDTSQNPSAADSNCVTVTTLPIADTTPPEAMRNLRIAAAYTQSVLLSWDPLTDYGGSPSASIEYCVGLNCTAYIVLVPTLASTHLAVSLTPGAVHCFRGLWTDAAGNQALAYSNVVCGATATAGLPQPRLQIPFNVQPLVTGASASAASRLPRP